MAEALQTVCTTAQRSAGHEQAFLRQTKLTEALLQTYHRRESDLNLLDYGCGVRGVQRVIFEGKKSIRDRLALFDPHAHIVPPATPDVRTVQWHEIFGPDRTTFDIIALSYVLCCVSPEEGRYILRDLRACQPQARLLIVDYTLATRSRMEVLQLLTAREEMKWRDRMGDTAFAETRRRFTRETLEDFVRSAGHDILGHAAPLDDAGIRSAVVTHPERESEIMVQPRQYCRDQQTGGTGLLVPPVVHLPC